MRFLFVFHDRVDYFAGPIVNARRLLPELVRRGHEVHCILFHTGGQAGSQAALERDGVRCVLRPFAVVTELQIPWLLSMVAAIGPDIFVPNLNIPACHASRWVRQAGIPTVAVHRSDDPFYWGLVDEFVTGPPERALSGLVCVSNAIATKVRGLNPAHTEICHIPSGVPIPKTMSDQSVKMRLVYCGRLVQRQKRVLDLVRTVGEVLREDPELQLTLTGSGPQRAELTALIAQLGLERRVLLSGAIGPDQVQSHLAQHQVLLLLSEYEGTPGAVMDGMAAGLVPVCLDIGGGVTELVQHERTGLLVKDRGESLLAAIRRLNRDAGLRQTLSRQARAHVEERFSLQRCADRWESFASRLLSEARPRSRVVAPARLDLPPAHPALAHEDRRSAPNPWPLARTAPVDRRIRLAVFLMRNDVLTETFIRAHIERLPFDVSVHETQTIQRGDLDPLIGRLKIAQVDAVLAEYGIVGAAVAAPCHRAGIPLFVHFHGFDASKRSVIASMKDAYAEMFAIASGVVTVSTPMRDRLLAMGARPQTLHLSPYGSDATIFRGADPASRPPLFIGVGRFVEKKAPYLTLLAFQRVLQEVPAARLCLVGSGSLLAPCRQIAKAIGVERAVLFAGDLPHAQVAVWMRRARAYVQHSLTAESGDSEGTPVAIIEAQLSGLPVVSTRHAGIPEVVVHGETGFLVSEGDVAGMAEQMLALARDPALAGRLGAAARGRALERHDLRASIARLSDIIRSGIDAFEVARGETRRIRR